LAPRPVVPPAAASGRTDLSALAGPVGSCSPRGLGALFAGIEEASGEIPLFPQALGHAGRTRAPRPRSSRARRRTTRAARASEAGRRASQALAPSGTGGRIQSARQCDKEYCPCKSNSVRLGSSPRAPARVGGRRAFGRGSGHRASPASLFLGAAFRAVHSSRRRILGPTLDVASQEAYSRTMASLMATIRKWLGLGKKS
jgi:hypothetical protein